MSRSSFALRRRFDFNWAYTDDCCSKCAHSVSVCQTIAMGRAARMFRMDCSAGEQNENNNKNTHQCQKENVFIKITWMILVTDDDVTTSTRTMTMTTTTKMMLMTGVLHCPPPPPFSMGYGFYICYRRSFTSSLLLSLHLHLFASLVTLERYLFIQFVYSLTLAYLLR